MLLGLIGFPLNHAWSASYFNEKFRQEGHPDKEYRLFPLTTLDGFPELLIEHQDLAGLSVTIPYKEKIIPYLDDLDETARLIGAVNTIKIVRERGKILTMGFNTDAPGFLQTLGRVPVGNALILGTGGASKAVAYALKKKNIRYLFVSRKSKGSGIIFYDELTVEVIHHNKLIINTTPVGMYPDNEQLPSIPYDFITADHFLYDLIYNPEETGFIKQGKLRNARTMNGMQMLINQAELSYRIFESR